MNAKRKSGDLSQKILDIFKHLLYDNVKNRGDEEERRTEKHFQERETRRLKGFPSCGSGIHFTASVPKREE